MWAGRAWPAHCPNLTRSPVRTLEAFYRGLLAALAGVAGLVLAATAALIPVNIVLRTWFSSGLFGIFEAIEYGLVAATFLAAPWVLAHNGHVTVDIGLMALSERQRRWIGRLTSLLGAVLCAVFLYYSLTATLMSAARGSTIRTTFIVQEWWVLSVMPVSMALMTVEFLRRLVRPVPVERHGAGL